VPRNVRLAEAPSHGLPGVLYDPQSKGAQAYLEFARELLARLASQSSAKPRVPAASSTAAAPDTPEH
jgi:chromosome partitioning protein